jgi:hypothetical protein
MPDTLGLTGAEKKGERKVQQAKIAREHDCDRRVNPNRTIRVDASNPPQDDSVNAHKDEEYGLRSLAIVLVSSLQANVHGKE